MRAETFNPIVSRLWHGRTRIRVAHRGVTLEDLRDAHQRVGWHLSHLPLRSDLPHDRPCCFRLAWALPRPLWEGCLYFMESLLVAPKAGGGEGGPGKG